MSHRNYRRKLITSLHPFADLWQDNVIINGGTYNDTDTNALNDFMLSIDSFKSKFPRLNLGIGGDLNACCTPQIYISGNGGSYDTPILYDDSNYSRTNGLYKVTPATNYIINCGYIANSDSTLNLNDNTIGFFSGGGLAVGWNNSSPDVNCGGANGWSVLCKYSSGETYFKSMTAASDSEPISSYEGLFIVRRTDANTVKLYRNNSLVTTKTRSAIAKPTSQLTIMDAPNYERKSFGYFVGYDLTINEMTILYNAWATLNTALGR